MKWLDAHHFICRLEKRGYRVIGRGAYSTVLAKGDSKRVIKVSRYTVDPWCEFALWAAQEGYAGTITPLVYSFRIIESRHGGMFYVAVVERLSTMVWQHANKEHETLANNISDLINGWGSEDRVPPQYHSFAKAFRIRFRDKMRYTYDFHGGNWMVEGDRLVLVDPLSGDGKSPTDRWRHDRLPGRAQLPSLQLAA
jgi:hypothetical protein